MTQQGIRAHVAATFAAMLPQYLNKELTGTKFRAAVMGDAQTKFSISVASAATHYNFALKEARKTQGEALKDLGRPDGKKGGRTPKTLVNVIVEADGSVVASGISKGKAKELIDAAKAAGKTALKMVDVPAAPAATTEQAATTGEATANTATGASDAGNTVVVDTPLVQVETKAEAGAEQTANAEQTA